jgi:ABC-type uncharacterized transport system permease subunit
MTKPTQTSSSEKNTILRTGKKNWDYIIGWANLAFALIILVWMVFGVTRNMQLLANQQNYILGLVSIVIKALVLTLLTVGGWLLIRGRNGVTLTLTAFGAALFFLIVQAVYASSFASDFKVHLPYLFREIIGPFLLMLYPLVACCFIHTRFRNYLIRRKFMLISFIVAFIIVIMFNAMNSSTTQALLGSMIRHSTPLVLGALCGLMGERAGVVNIGIEGQMLMSAFIGFLVNVWTGSLLLAVLVASLAGGVMGLMLAYMSVTLKLNQIIGGTVINILALGLTGFLYQPGLRTLGKLTPIPLGPLTDIPLIGPVLFNNPPITYLAIILVFVVHFVIFKTRWGLRTRAVGEHPKAADTLGVNVYFVRYINVIAGGALAGLAGAFISLEDVGSFERAMTNGRGFVALAVMIFGKWTPLGAWGAALLFGMANAIQTQLQFDKAVNIPHQFIGSIPYLLTILVLAGFVGRARMPAADGTPYEKES